MPDIANILRTAFARNIELLKRIRLTVKEKLNQINLLLDPLSSLPDRKIVSFIQDIQGQIGHFHTEIMGFFEYYERELLKAHQKAQKCNWEEWQKIVGNMKDSISPAGCISDIRKRVDRFGMLLLWQLNQLEVKHGTKKILPRNFSQETKQVIDEFLKLGNYSIYKLFVEDEVNSSETYLFIRKYLLRQRWYLTPERIKPIQLMIAEAVEKGEHEQITLSVQKLIRQNVDVIRRELSIGWPQRAKILQDAFSAHQHELYTLSVPVFIAQADGMCMDCFWEGEADKHKYGFYYETPNLLIQEKISGALVDMESKVAKFLSPLSPGLTFDMLVDKTDNRTQQFGEKDIRKRKKKPEHNLFNRNGILHGADIEYATEANSLRAISLLDYLNTVKRLFDQRNEEIRNLY